MVLALISLIPFTVMALIFASRVINPPLTDKEIEDTRALCSSIQLPGSFIKVKDYSLIKSGLADIGTTYISSEDPKSVEDFFIRELTQRGWEYHKESYSDHRVFRKGRASVIIEYGQIGFTSKYQYSLDCTIGDRQ